MDTTTMTPLERKIFGHNLIQDYTEAQIRHIYPQLEKLVGVKIWTLKGQSAKFNVDLLDFPYIAESGSSYRRYFNNSGYSLVLENDVTVKDRNYPGGGYGVSYYKHSVYLGTVKDGVLTELRPLSELLQYLVKYDVKEQEELAVKISELETQIRALRSKQMQ